MVVRRSFTTGIIALAAHLVATATAASITLLASDSSHTVG
jgi:hypothetical protein